MSGERPDGSAIRFGEFELDLDTGELRRDRVAVDLAPQPTTLLLLLARNRGRLVTRERIREELWPDSVVEFDAAINAAVRQIRDALGDDAADPRYVETVPRRGYRLAAADGGTPAAGVAGPPGRTSPRTRRPGRAAGVLVVLAALAAGAVLLSEGREARSGITVAVVPARVADAGSAAEGLGESLTDSLLAALGALESEGVRALRWAWDITYDPEAGRVRRDGEPLEVDLALDVNVDLRAGEWAISASLSNLADGRQVWYRRFSHPASDATGARERVVAAVVEALRENAGATEGGPPSRP